MIFLLIFTIVCASAYSGPYQRSSQRYWYNSQQPRLYQPRIFGSLRDLMGQRSFNSPRAVLQRYPRAVDADDDLVCLGLGDPLEDTFLLSLGDDKWILPHAIGLSPYVFGAMLYVQEGPIQAFFNPPVGKPRPYTIINRSVQESDIPDCPIVTGEVRTSYHTSECHLYWFYFLNYWTFNADRSKHAIGHDCSEKNKFPNNLIFTFIPYIEEEPEPHVAYKICPGTLTSCGDLWISASFLNISFETIRDNYQEPMSYKLKNYGSFRDLGRKSFNSPRTVIQRYPRAVDADDDLVCLGLGDPLEDTFLLSLGDDKWILPHAIGFEKYVFGAMLYVQEGPIEVFFNPPVGKPRPYTIINRSVQESDIPNCPIVTGEVRTSYHTSVCHLYWFNFLNYWTYYGDWYKHAIGHDCGEKNKFPDNLIFTFIPYIEEEPVPHVAYKICPSTSTSCGDLWISASFPNMSFETIRDNRSR